MNIMFRSLISAGVVGALCFSGPSAAGIHSGILGLASGPNSTAACALLADRKVVCWGDLYRDGSMDHSPQQIDNLSRADDVVLGMGFGCARLLDSTAACWGGADEGQLGDGKNISRGKAMPVGTSAAPFGDVVGIAAGALHVCAVKVSGNVYCWGYNANRQLGNYNVTADSFNNPLIVVMHDFFMNPALAGVTSVSAGYYFSCAMQGSSALCWGQNADGQIGNGAAVASIDGPTRVVKDSAPFGMIADTLKAGANHVCALLPDSSPYHVSCWGGNAQGQLGNTTSSGTDIYGNPYNSDPSEVIFAGGGLLTDVQAVTQGGAFGCGRLADHTIACWGMNDVGQLGDFHTTAANSPSPVGVYTQSGDLLGSAVPILDVQAGGRHVCALDSNSDVFCWGDNTYGQLGTPFGGSSPVPFKVAVDAPIFTDDLEND